MIFTDHARRRMVERGITQEQIQLVLNRPLGDPGPGAAPGTLVIEGQVGARRLKVIRSAAEPPVIVSVWWV